MLSMKQCHWNTVTLFIIIYLSISLHQHRHPSVTVVEFRYTKFKLYLILLQLPYAWIMMFGLLRIWLFLYCINYLLAGRLQHRGKQHRDSTSISFSLLKLIIYSKIMAVIFNMVLRILLSQVHDLVVELQIQKFIV